MPMETNKSQKVVPLVQNGNLPSVTSPLKELKETENISTIDHWLTPAAHKHIHVWNCQWKLKDLKQKEGRSLLKPYAPVEITG